LEQWRHYFYQLFDIKSPVDWLRTETLLYTLRINQEFSYYRKGKGKKKKKSYKAALKASGMISR
jgi:hypothetical protein